MQQLLKHKDNLNEYIGELYENESKEDELNSMFGTLNDEGLISCDYADNRAHHIQLTLKGKNIPMSDLKTSDKEELVDLIHSIDDISLLFHSSSRKSASYDEINDVLEFQNWLQELVFLLQSIQDRGYDIYISDTIKLCRHHWNGTDDRRKFNELSGRLSAIEKNIDKYYPEESNMMNKQQLRNNEFKKYDVFISHANKDKSDYVEDLYLTIKKLGIEVFYDKETFDWGDNWKQKIYDGVESSEFAIIVISNNYFGREWTENELHAFLNRQNSNGEKIILPLLHGISISDLTKQYPELGDIQAICDSQYDVKDVAILFAKQLLKRYRRND